MVNSIEQFWIASKSPWMVSRLRGNVMAKWCFNRTMHLPTAQMPLVPTLRKLEWEILPHPPYSPDIAPSDYHLFRSMKNHLHDVRLQNDAQLENWVANFLKAKSTTTFYQRGIQRCPASGKK